MAKIGAEVLGPDNGSYMLYGENPPSRCERCGFVRNHDWINPRFKLNRLKRDLSWTYDGYVIASDRFRQFAAGLGGSFTPLPSTPGYYVFSVEETVTFDVENSWARWENLCEACGQYESFVGPNPMSLVDRRPLPDRFVRTDREFGSEDGKHPVFMVGLGLAEAIREERFSGVYLDEFDEDPKA